MQSTAVRKKNLATIINKNKYLFLFSLPGFLLCLIFNYGPMWGVLIAFKNFSIFRGFFASEWIGFDNFMRFFKDPYFFRLIRNTFLLSFYNLLYTFPAPIILALFINEIKHTKFKKVTQTIAYLPHFISTVVIVGLLKDFLSSTGIVNKLLNTNINFFNDPAWFRTLYIGSGLWQGVGWGTIIYIAAISGISPELYESAELDGASRLKKMWYITLPGIQGTTFVLLILNIGRLMNVGFEKVYLMYNPITYETADVISTYVYRKGLEESDFGFGTSVGLFNSVINLVLLIIANTASRKFSENSLW